ncbi:MAG: competence/damage-inducible protein A [Planctomycetota bacterium]
MRQRKKKPIVELVATGNEIIEGRVVDTNAVFASRKLINAGFEIAWRSLVGDEKRRFLNVLNTAFKRADIIIISGGLGPTEDDLTRAACAAVLNTKLVYNKTAEKHISGILARYGRIPDKTELRQAYFPKHNTKIVPNKNGTACGFICEKNGKILSALSGVPSEYEQMLTQTVLPFLKKKYKTTNLPNKIFNTIGKSESEIQKIVYPIISNYKLSWGITARQMVISVSISAGSDKKSQFKSACKELRKSLAEISFSEDSIMLEESVLQLLKEHHYTLAVAESCTGGLILDKLTDIPGASDVLVEGVVSYSNDSKVRRLGVHRADISKFGAVSEEVARQMASGVRRNSSADIGIATTGIAGPGGAAATKPVGLVYIAFAAKKSVHVKKFTFTGNRRDIKERAANAALSMIHTFCNKG